ncbi:MAG: hypothetical protein K0S07_959 [Chlamydiales bacterium]|jgi:hypothetical protein|nr:hypothetical protein [Chlamydiales bacterium]
MGREARSQALRKEPGEKSKVKWDLFYPEKVQCLEEQTGPGAELGNIRSSDDYKGWIKKGRPIKLWL